MDLIQQLLLTRRADGARMGYVTDDTSSGFRAVRVRITGGTPGPWITEHATLDAAVRWVESNPFLPDPQTCPHHQGVYGPELARWGAHHMVGCVHLTNSECRTAPGVDAGPPLNASLLLALDESGIVQARLAQTESGWTLVLKSAGKRILRRRARWADAVQMFRTEVVQHLYTGSMHQRLQLLHDGAGFDARATRFQHDRRALQDAVYPAPFPPPRAIVRQTGVIRGALCLGTFHTENDIIVATRYEETGPSSTCPHASFDAAVAWIRSRI